MKKLMNNNYKTFDEAFSSLSYKIKSNTNIWELKRLLRFSYIYL